MTGTHPSRPLARSAAGQVRRQGRMSPFWRTAHGRSRPVADIVGALQRWHPLRARAGGLDRQIEKKLVTPGTPLTVPEQIGLTLIFPLVMAATFWALDRGLSVSLGTGPVNAQTRKRQKLLSLAIWIFVTLFFIIVFFCSDLGLIPTQNGG